MLYQKKYLDTPFSKFIEGATNPETPRKFIRSSELEFGIKTSDVDSMTEEKLNEYINWLDDLWNK